MLRYHAFRRHTDAAILFTRDDADTNTLYHTANNLHNTRHSYNRHVAAAATPYAIFATPRRYYFH